MAEKELSKKLGEVEVDGLVTAIDPHIVIGAGLEIGKIPIFTNRRCGCKKNFGVREQKANAAYNAL